MSVDSIEAYEVKSFKASVNELCKILYDDSDDYVDYMEKFLEKYSFDKYKSFILEHQDILKEAPLLDLILDKVLPATFASIFMKAIHLYTLVGMSHVFYLITFLNSFKMNMTKSYMRRMAYQKYSTP